MSHEFLGLVLLGLLFVVILSGFPISFTLFFLGMAFGYLGLGERVFHLMTYQVFSTMMDTVLAAVDDILRAGETRRLDEHPPAIDRESRRLITDEALRREATAKVRWDTLSLDSRRRILEPVISPEFRSPAAGPENFDPGEHELE